MKHRGSLEELKAILVGSGHPIRSVEKKDTFYRIVTTHGAICNWHPSRGTVVFQGKEDKRKALETAVTRYMKRVDSQSAGATAKPSKTRKSSKKKRIFVVHGHDLVALDQLELVLHRLGLEPVVLMNTSGGGQTIIEALEREIGKESNRSHFGIVLLTPDDIGFAVKHGGEHGQPRPRQNVVMEMGMLLSRLGRKNVAVLKKQGMMELPSDTLGIIYIEFQHHVKETVPKLAARLQEAGFQLTAQAIASAGM